MIRSVAVCLLLAACCLAQDPPPPPSRNVVIKQPTEAERPTTALLGLRSITWQEAEPMIKPMLTKEGTVGYFSARNAIIVRDQKQVVDQVRQFLEDVDRDPVNIRVKVELVGDTLRKHGKLGVSVSASTGILVGHGGKLGSINSVGLSVENRTTTEDRSDTMQLLVRSGAAGKLWVGERIPDPAWLRQYKLVPFSYMIYGNHTLATVPIVLPTEWRNIGSALYVRPTYQENDVVHLELFPVLTFIDGDGDERFMQVQEVKTEVYAKPGQRVFIGGTDQAWTRFTRELFKSTSISTDEKTGGVSIYATPFVTVMQRPKD